MSKNRNRDFSRKVPIGEYVFCFVEAKDYAYYYTLKDGRHPVLILFVNVIDKEGTIVAEYERLWENDFNTSHVYAFMDKFVQDAKYRQQFQTRGKVITEELPKSNDLVKPPCAKAIQWINSAKPEKLKFRDFAALKTYGRDKVSSMKFDVLKDIVTEEELEQISGSVGEEDVISVLRWVKRGLHIDHAIHKVRVDREIANNTGY